MNITLYTIKDCQFSKQEKEYLTSHSLTFEEKDLEANKEFLTEMMAVSNNFAGTPVTKIEKDDGTIAILKGFTKEEFDKILGFAEEAPKTDIAALANTSGTPTPDAKTPTTQNPAESVKNDAPPMPPMEMPESPPSTPAAPEMPVSQTPSDDKPLNDVMSKLENNMDNATLPTTPPTTDSTTTPSIPDLPGSLKS